MQCTVRWAGGGGTIVRPTGVWSKEMEEEERRERRRRQQQNVVNCCKKVAAFLFSHIGLAGMVVAYSIMGGFLFKALEAPAELSEKRETNDLMNRLKDDHIKRVWQLTATVCLDSLDKHNFTEKLRGVLKTFQEEVIGAVKDKGWEGKEDITQASLQWSFAGALLYAVTVITTIGYGHVAPKTPWGRLITILYALVGIPLTFLYLSNIGNFLADCFRLFYKKVCCDICCCQKCERQKKRERFRMKRRKELAAQRNTVLASPADIVYTSADETTPLPHLRENTDDEEEYVVVGESLSGSEDSAGLPRDDSLGHANQAMADSSESLIGSSSVSPSSPEALQLSNSSNLAPQNIPPLKKSKSPSPAPSDGVRETAILDSDTEEEEDIRETAILDDDLDDEKLQNIKNESKADLTAPQTPSSQLSDGFFTKLEDSKETAILNDSDDDNVTAADLSKENAAYEDDSKEDAIGKENDIELVDTLSVPGGHDSRKDEKRSRWGRKSKKEKKKSKERDKSSERNKSKDRDKSKERNKSKERDSSKERDKSQDRDKSKYRKESDKDKNNSIKDTDKNRKREKSTSRKSKNGNKNEGKDHTELKLKISDGDCSPSRTKSPTSELCRSKSKKKDNIQRKDTLKISRKNESSVRGKGNSKRNNSASSDDKRSGVTIGSGVTAGSSNSDNTEADGNNRRSLHQSEESFVTAPSDDISYQADDLASDVFCDSETPCTSSGKTPLNGVELSDDESACAGYTGDSVTINVESPYGDMDVMDYADLVKENTPMNFVDDPFDYDEEEEDGKVTVPISICLILIGGYIFAGSVLFTLWEEWDYLTGSYFCFITLSTIGFGDIVPGTDVSEWNSSGKLVLCALWLAFGLSLLAMCFNLMQEEVKDKSKWVGTKLGLLRDESER